MFIHEFFCIVLKEQSFKRISSGDALVDPPVPIPNTVVKHQEAESTCLETGWEDRKLLVEQAPCGVLFCNLPRKNSFFLFQALTKEGKTYIIISRERYTT